MTAKSSLGWVLSQINAQLKKKSCQIKKSPIQQSTAGLFTPVPPATVLGTSPLSSPIHLRKAQGLEGRPDAPTAP